MGRTVYKFRGEQDSGWEALLAHDGIGLSPELPKSVRKFSEGIARAEEVGWRVWRAHSQYGECLLISRAFATDGAGVFTLLEVVVSDELTWRRAAIHTADWIEGMVLACGGEVIGKPRRIRSVISFRVESINTGICSTEFRSTLVATAGDEAGAMPAKVVSMQNHYCPVKDCPISRIARSCREITPVRSFFDFNFVSAFPRFVGTWPG